MAGKAIFRAGIWPVLVGLLGVCPAAWAQSDAGAASVVLMLRIEESVAVRWTSQDATSLLRGSAFLSGGASEPRNWEARIFAFQTTWQLALGRTVQVETHLEGAAPGEGSLLELRVPGDEKPEAGAFGFVSSDPTTRLTLVEGIDPQRGRQEHVSGVMLLHSKPAEDAPQVLRLRLTAL